MPDKLILKSENTLELIMPKTPPLNLNILF
jgi:hypothetical protein